MFRPSQVTVYLISWGYRPARPDPTVTPQTRCAQHMARAARATRRNQRKNFGTVTSIAGCVNNSRKPSA